MAFNYPQQTKVVVSVDVRRVTRVGGLTVHPSMEDTLRWGVTARSGISAGKFYTRRAAEHYAAALGKLADWETHPEDTEAALAWASDLSARRKSEIEDAMVEARQMDVAAEWQP